MRKAAIVCIFAICVVYFLKKMRNNLGIMQGRLTEPRGRGIQFFPFENWENEFRICSELGLDEIEFIFDLDDYEKNPLWSEAGITRIRELIDSYKVNVNSVCADFFMGRPFFRVVESVRLENINVFKKIITNAAAIGAHNIEIPLVDNSSLKTEDDKKILIYSLGECLGDAEKYGITLSLETDLVPQKFLSLLKDSNHPAIRANYDTGNSSALGYDPGAELSVLGPYLENVHIKDRVLGGATVPLGEGSADFGKVFQGLKKLSYNGSLILQAARGEEGSEMNTIRNQIDFIRRYLHE